MKYVTLHVNYRRFVETLFFLFIKQGVNWLLLCFGTSQIHRMDIIVPTTTFTLGFRKSLRFMRKLVRLDRVIFGEFTGHHQKLVVDVIGNIFFLRRKSEGGGSKVIINVLII